MIMNYPDGSTSRQVRGDNKQRVQLLCMMVRWAHEHDDWGLALEALEEVKSHAEHAFIFDWLTSKQRQFLRDVEAYRHHRGRDHRAPLTGVPGGREGPRKGVEGKGTARAHEASDVSPIDPGIGRIELDEGGDGRIVPF